VKKKILILGSSGLIGHQLYNYLNVNNNYELHNISYRKKLNSDSIQLNARNEKKLITTINSIAPKYIINCIGALISDSKKNPENAIYLNAYLPHRLIRIADNIGAKLIHISTDCVFSGDKDSPYLENDYKDGKDIYAKTKGLGEVINDSHLTIRTSVVGPELKQNSEELFHWFMSQSGEIQGYTNALWSGVTSLELAKAIEWSIKKNIVGLYHVTNNIPISKYDLLELFKKYTNKNINIIPNNKIKIDKSFIDTRLLINYKIPSYDQMISDMVSLIANNRSLYYQYKARSFDKE